jgi:hypothetical protein
MSVCFDFKGEIFSAALAIGKKRVNIKYQLISGTLIEEFNT